MIAGRTALPTDTCPHGTTLGDCTESWCRARVDDLLHGEHKAAILGEPETVDEARDGGSAPFRGQASDLAGLIAVTTKPRWPKGAHGCPRCGSWWTGDRTCHCSACHQTFGGLTAFDGHRYGTHHPPSRGCRTAEWMREKGWAPDDRGIWRLPAPTTPITYREGI